ncbi:MAG: hypothetical protein JOZ62_10310 [Acidobacteriaceae bacterium]|nr:hypothetical protein [Acidobacteriaceae bacterium]
MKSALRVAYLASILVSVALIKMAADVSAPDSSGLTVHEWGTFTSVAGEDGSAMDWDTLGCKNDLPRFVYDYGYRGFKLRLQGTVRMETPVLFFYAPHPLNARVKVSFPQGVITEWYPRAACQVFRNTGNDGSSRPVPANVYAGGTFFQNLTGGIEWKNVQVQPGSHPALPVENTPNRYYAARETDSAPVSVDGQSENFLFYRGVAQLPVPVCVRISGDGSAVIENRDGKPVPKLVLFENYNSRIGYRTAGPLQGALTLRAPQLKDSLPALLDDLQCTLTEQGLFPKEAAAMLNTWKDSWFEEGSRLIYIVPSAMLQIILPLEIEPAPAHTARVFVGRIELITPETERVVASAIANSDAVTLARYGRFLHPILERLYPQDARKAGEIERLLRRYELSHGGCDFR